MEHQFARRKEDSPEVKLKTASIYSGAIVGIIGAITLVGSYFWAAKDANFADHVAIKTELQERNADIRVVNTKLDNIAKSQDELKRLLSNR